MDDHPFSAPHDWCDRQCERCPLASACGVPLAEMQSAAAHEARGDDWDPLDDAVADMCGSLEAAIVDLTSLDEHSSLESDPDHPGARRLRDAAAALMLAFSKVAQTDRRRFAAAVITSTKVMRISTYLMLGATGADVWRVDAVPNLLLLERAKAELRRFLVGRRDRACRDAADALDVLDEILDPLVAAIGPEPRRALRVLEERGGAPSPFCLSARPTSICPILQ